MLFIAVTVYAAGSDVETTGLHTSPRHACADSCIDRPGRLEVAS
jgi:hypothetical protein